MEIMPVSCVWGAAARVFTVENALGLLYLLLATLALYLLLRLLAWLRRRVITRIERSAEAYHPITVSGSEIASGPQVSSFLAGLSKLVYDLVVLGLFYLYLLAALAAFPATRSYVNNVLDALVAGLTQIGLGILRAIPNLIVILLIVLIARVLLGVLRFFFTAVDAGRIVIPGIRKEWAMPTYALVKITVVVGAFMAAFPRIPGSESPFVQGIAVFVGALATLGAAGTVANLIAGILIIYVEPFVVGELVRVGDSEGIVLEKTLITTRILTLKNEEIVLPNSIVLGTPVLNYSGGLRHGGLILHTTVTIGYDVPWQKVHSLLLDSARRTDHVMESPAPFILQSQLGDYSAAYELNAYTDSPSEILNTYSGLHQNIQSLFAEAGVEILSPGYMAVRDGNKPAIPEERV